MVLFKATKPNYTLVATSLSFGIASILCYLHNQYLLSTLTAMLMLTSIQFHGNPALLAFLLDQTMIGAVICTGFVIMWPLGLTALSLALMFKCYCIFIYYGPYRDSLAYHPNQQIADVWHGSMHVVLALLIAGLCILLNNQRPLSVMNGVEQG